MYRENIAEFMREEKAILYAPKNGGLNDYVVRLLPEIGVDPKTGIVKKDNKDVALVKLEEIRGEDVPQMVFDSLNRGRYAFGLTGDDLFDESPLKGGLVGVRNTYDWWDPEAEFNRPALVLMNRTGTFGELSVSSDIAINKKYEKTSLEYLRKRLIPKKISYKVTSYAGDTERTVANGTNDACVEIVYRGSKSKDSAKSKAGLQNVEVVRFSDIALLGEDVTNPWMLEYGRVLRASGRESMTARYKSDKNRLVKKVGEESAELVAAFLDGKNLSGEALDVVYGAMMMLAVRGVNWGDLETELVGRWK